MNPTDAAAEAKRQSEQAFRMEGAETAVLLCARYFEGQGQLALHMVTASVPFLDNVAANLSHLAWAALGYFGGHPRDLELALDAQSAAALTGGPDVIESSTHAGLHLGVAMIWDCNLAIHLAPPAAMRGICGLVPIVAGLLSRVAEPAEPLALIYALHARIDAVTEMSATLRAARAGL